MLLCRVMKIRIALAAVLFTAAAFAQSAGIGVSLAGLNSSPADRIKLAKELGAAWYRPEPVLLSGSASCDDCASAHAAELKLLLVIRNSAGSGKPSDAVKDIAAFQQRVRAVIERDKPNLLVVETEPDDGKSFAGSVSTTSRLGLSRSMTARTLC